MGERERGRRERGGGEVGEREVGIAEKRRQMTSLSLSLIRQAPTMLKCDSFYTESIHVLHTKNNKLFIIIKQDLPS